MKIIKFFKKHNLIFILVIFSVLMFLNSKTIISFFNKKKEIGELKNEITALEKKNDELEEKIKDLKTNPKLIEVLARTKLGMVKKDEIVYKIH